MANTVRGKAAKIVTQSWNGRAESKADGHVIRDASGRWLNADWLPNLPGWRIAGRVREVSSESAVKLGWSYQGPLTLMQIDMAKRHGSSGWKGRPPQDHLRADGHGLRDDLGMWMNADWDHRKDKWSVPGRKDLVSPDEAVRSEWTYVGPLYQAFPPGGGRRRGGKGRGPCHRLSAGLPRAE